MLQLIAMIDMFTAPTANDAGCIVLGLALQLIILLLFMWILALVSHVLCTVTVVDLPCLVVLDVVFLGEVDGFRERKRASDSIHRYLLW